MRRLFVLFYLFWLTSIAISAQTQSNSGDTSQPRSAPADAPASRLHAGPSVITFSDPPAPARAAATPLHADWRFAHPHPDLLLAINAAAVRQSPTLRSLLAQLAPSVNMTPDDVESALAQTGDIDRFYISMHSTETLVVLQGGRINAPPVPVWLNNGMIAYGVSRNAVVIGHEPSAGAAAQRARAAGAPLTDSQLKAQEASDVWVMGTRAMLNQQNVQLSSLSDGLSSYTLGLSLREGLKADLALNYATLAAARRTLAALRGTPLPPEWPVHISSETVGTVVRMKIVVQQAELSQALAKALAAPGAKPFLDIIARRIQRSGQMMVYGPDGSKAIHTIPAAPPPPGKLVIYGMPGGPKVM
ncbi:MAG TPA: hypothetical protein VMD98_05230 [Bryocella sp.]|nr:hypothetical protein [Bryocella sp.]